MDELVCTSHVLQLSMFTGHSYTVEYVHKLLNLLFGVEAISTHLQTN